MPCGRSAEIQRLVIHLFELMLARNRLRGDRSASSATQTHNFLQEDFGSFAARGGFVDRLVNTGEGSAEIHPVKCVTGCKESRPGMVLEC